MASLLKTVGWFLVFAGILVGVLLFCQLVDFSSLGQSARDAADANNPISQLGYSVTKTVFFSGLGISVGTGLALAIPGLILTGIGELISTIQDSRAAVMNVLYKLASAQTGPVERVAATEESPTS